MASNMLNWPCRSCQHQNKVAEVTHADVKDAKKKFKSDRIKCEACGTEHYVLTAPGKEVQTTLIT